MDHQRDGEPGTTRVPEADGREDPQLPERVREGTTPDPAPHRASWVLVAACLLPPLLLAELTRQVLTGGRDRPSFSAYSGYSADGDPTSGLDVTWRMRFSALWSAAPVTQTLLGALPGLFALCAVTLARRPGWLVPTRTGRWVAAGAAGLTALESLLTVLVLLAGADDTDDASADRAWLLNFSEVPRGFPEVAPVLALLAVTTALPVLAGLLLLRPGQPPAAVPDRGPGTLDPPGRPREHGPAPREPGEPAGPDAAPPPELPQIPRLRAEDRDRYRRPGS